MTIIRVAALRPLFAAMALGVSLSTFLAEPLKAEYVPEANHAIVMKKHAAEWAREDSELDRKLSALEQKYGKKPNIIYILSDDVGWGTLGCYGGGKICGMPTPNLDKMAHEGMKFLSAYAEPSCTPTRLALLTGRYPTRTGVNEVLWPGMKVGLVSSEHTIAEILSDGVYSYLKAEGLLTDNDNQAGRIHAVLDQVRKICASNEEEKNENCENSP